MRWQIGLALTVLGLCGFVPGVNAQSITAAADGTATQVQVGDRTYTITGGSRAGDNLFHSFQAFGLAPHEVADFLASPQVGNILSRVTGGDPSLIHGLIQVTGSNANLYLMNPAGIVFGAGAQLNVSGDFTATTATGIGWGGDRWFHAFGANDYSQLVGTPSLFAFDTLQPGAILNAGELQVAAGQQLALLGGRVANTGRLHAPAGEIVVAAVPGTSRVRLSQTGSLLSLEVEVPTNASGQILPIRALDLPQLLTGSGLDASQVGTAAIAGQIDVAGIQGGNVTVVGDRVGLWQAEIDASGTQQGGQVRLGGNWRGGDGLWAAQQVFVAADSQIRVDAEGRGNGGTAIVWADETTQFYGQVSARGGAIAGDGGFIEVSGQQFLDFQGQADASAPHGLAGTLLLDPADLEIVAETGNLASLPVGFATGPLSAQLSATVLNSATSNIILEATNTITFSAAVKVAAAGIGLQATANNGITVNADLITNGGAVTLQADADGNGGALTLNNATLNTGSGDITLTGRGHPGAAGGGTGGTGHRPQQQPPDHHPAATSRSPAAAVRAVRVLTNQMELR
ncbi:MAG: filamentous hemagglutinin N-terminal domain-containing protein, partial [Spirulinaceae cyanobacterium SM2_1_0]|nr:filamentous hemagglutinin N-terminal domain-containing protein [Spirulinaceae cyanobacterium SM2_1_0]